ncbi:MAG TPA: hypothetical protein DCG54_09630 [Anaerolineae bacterium]|jgi:hypothetical protein|nr:hypothetical protein [Anaerolineae bacterium]
MSTWIQFEIGDIERVLFLARCNRKDVNEREAYVYRAIEIAQKTAVLCEDEITAAVKMAARAGLPSLVSRLEEAGRERCQL